MNISPKDCVCIYYYYFYFYLIYFDKFFLFIFILSNCSGRQQRMQADLQRRQLRRVFGSRHMHDLCFGLRVGHQQCLRCADLQRRQLRLVLGSRHMHDLCFGLRVGRQQRMQADLQRCQLRHLLSRRHVHNVCVGLRRWEFFAFFLNDYFAEFGQIVIFDRDVIPFN